MRSLATALAFALAFAIVSTKILSGTPPNGTVTPGPNRTITVCVDDPEDPPGTPETIELYVDHQNRPYDRFTLADGSCTTRGYAPFGPATHLAWVKAIDSEGQGNWILSGAMWSETCADFGVGSKLWGYCNDVSGQAYYPVRQQYTKPLISQLAWAGVDTAGGGAIRQLYSADRSFNLLDEHPGGSLQLSLWGGVTAGPALPASASNGCNGWDPAVGGPLMNIIMTQGPLCSWGKPVGYVDLGFTTGITTHLPDPENHLRQWTMQDFPMWTGYYNRGEYLELNYRFINGTAWDFGENDQEIPAIHLNAGMHYGIYWGTGGWDTVGGGWGATQIRLSSPVSPGPYIEPGVMQATWAGSWVTVCDASYHCITVAPHDPPSASGINMASIWSNITFSGTETNLISLLGRYTLPGLPSAPNQADKSIKIYVFPYGYWEAPNGVTVRSRLLQLRGWL